MQASGRAMGEGWGEGKISNGVALSHGLYPTRRIVVAPRVEGKHPNEVACDARRLGGSQSQKSGGCNGLLSH